MILITGMNLTWGAIDAVIYYLLNVFEQRRFVRLMSMPDGPDREGRVDMMMDAFGGTPLDILDPESEREVCSRILDMRVESERDLGEDRRSMRMSSIGCFVITALTLVPIAVPILLIPDLDLGLGVASAVSSVILMAVGYRIAPALGVSRWGLALFLTVISWAITIVATFTGG